MSSLGQVAIFLAASVIAVPIFRKLGLSSILAYLASGIAIGPWAIGLVKDPEAIMHVGELGVVLLLFVIGLELQPSRLKALRKSIFGLGLLQVLVTTGAFMGIGIALGLDVSAAFVVGFAFSLSSTPLVLQLLAERHKLNSMHGRSAFGILLFQDIAVMPVLAILPLLASGTAMAGGGFSWTNVSIGIGTIIALLVAGRTVLRPLLRVIAATKVSEAFTAMALLVVIGTALVVDHIGLSMGLGAFIAGVLLADSEYRHELEADIEPFKGLLLGLFFMAVGMAANIGLLVERPGTVIALVTGVVLVKMALLWGLGLVTRHNSDSARGLAFALPQAGEFGFVLFPIAVASMLISRDLADLLVIVVTLSMILSPLLMIFQEKVLEPRLVKSPGRPFDEITSNEGRVIVAGIGRFGQVVSRILRMRKIRFTALDANVEQVDLVRKFGNTAYFGDVGRLELLQAAGAEHAELFVLAIDDVQASIRTADLVRRHYPHLKVFARARNRQHAMALMELGVHYVVREAYFSSLDMSKHVLDALGIPHAEVQESIKKFDEMDRALLQQQREMRHEEDKLVQSAQEAARELERIFENEASIQKPTSSLIEKPALPDGAGSPN